MADWPVHSPHCRNCKKAIDNLAYSAKNQGQEDWWKTVRKDEAELRALVKKYQETCPVSDTKKRGTFNLARYLEEFKASSSVINDDLGVMMHKSRYVAWAMTAANPEGAMSQSQAESKWATMAEAAESGEWLSNRSGPALEPLQLRIKTGDQVIFRNEFGHSKIQQVQQNKDVHKATASSVEAGRRSILRDHERGLGLEGQHKDFGGIAQAMLQNMPNAQGGSGPRDSAFAGAGVFLPNVQVLQDEIAEEKAATEEAKKQAKHKNAMPPDGSPAGSSPGRPGSSNLPGDNDDKGSFDGSASKRAKPWFDEGFINKSKRTQEQMQQKLADLMEKTVKTALDALQEPTGVGQLATHEAQTLTARLKFLLVTLGYQPESDAQVQQLTAQRLLTTKRLQESEQTQALRALKETVAQGRAPCEGYQDLEPRQLLEVALATGFADLQNKAQCKDEVIAFCRGIESRRAPLVSLCKSVSRAAKDVAAAQKSQKRVAKQAQQKDEPAQKKARTSTATPSKVRQPAVFESAATHGTQIQVLCVDPDDGNKPSSFVDLAAPLVLSGGNWKSLERDSAFQPALAQFKKAWMASQMRQQTGRASQKLTGPCAQAAEAAATNPLGKHLSLASPGPQRDNLEASMAPVFFAAAGGTETVFVEKDGLAAIRLCLGGIREVATVGMSHWASAMAQPQAAPKVEPGQFAKLCGALLSAPAVRIQAAGHIVHYGTLGPGDVLYTPPGWIVAEKVKSTANKNGDVSILAQTARK